MTLRRFHLIVTTVTCTLAIATATALVALARDQAEAAERATLATTSIGACERLQLYLLRHNRNSYLELLTGDPRHGDAVASLESAIVQVQDVLARSSDSPQEHALVHTVRHRVREYLDVHWSGSDTDREPMEVYLAAQEPLDEAYDATAALASVNEQEFAASGARASRARSWSLAVGAAMAALVLSGTAASIYAANRFVYGPLFALERSIRAYSSRNGDVRAPESGADELRAIGRTFNEMAAEIARRRERELTFLAGIAHDLRTPLTHLKLLVETSATADLPPERLRERLLVATRQVGHLDRMVGDLLDVARIEAGRLEIRPEDVDLAEEVRRVAALFETAANPIRIDAPPTAPATCDPFRLSQVIANLLSNAQKYSPPGSPIEVAIGPWNGGSEIRISDHGGGIPEKERERIFEPFYRSDGSRRGGPPGAGLGLSVARRIVEAHGGRIWAEAAPGGGALIRIQLPRMRRTLTAPGADTPGSAAEPPHASA